MTRLKIEPRSMLCLHAKLRGGGLLREGDRQSCKWGWIMLMQFLYLQVPHLPSTLQRHEVNWELYIDRRCVCVSVNLYLSLCTYFHVLALPRLILPRHATVHLNTIAFSLAL